MCEIGKPIEIIDVEPLSLPASLTHWEKNPPERPVDVPVPVEVEDRVEVPAAEGTV